MGGYYMQDWPTQEKDLLVAQCIIDKHIDINDGNSLEICEYIVDDRLEVNKGQPEWVMEIIHTFQRQYGPENGLDVSFKILSRCMIDGEIVH